MSGVWYDSALCVVAKGLWEFGNKGGRYSGAIGASCRIIEFPLRSKELFQHQRDRRVYEERWVPSFQDQGQPVCWSLCFGEAT